MGRAPNENVEKAYDLFKKGTPLVEISRQLGIPEGTVRRWKSVYKWGSERSDKQSERSHKKKNVPKRFENNTVDEECESLTEALTEKERLFCEIYMRNFNATQAARAAGYSYNSASVIGYETLRKPHVRNYLAYLKDLKRESICVDIEDLVERHMRMAFSDITDFVDFGISMQPVMTAIGPLTQKNPVTGQPEPVLKPVNTIQFKSSYEVDGGLISEISVGRDGAKVKLVDREKHMAWLERYFMWNPLDKHKVDFDNARLALDRERLELDKKRADKGDDDETEYGVVILPEVKPELDEPDDDDDNGGENDG